MKEVDVFNWDINKILDYCHEMKTIDYQITYLLSVKTKLKNLIKVHENYLKGYDIRKGKDENTKDFYKYLSKQVDMSNIKYIAVVENLVIDRMEVELKPILKIIKSEIKKLKLHSKSQKSKQKEQRRVFELLNSSFKSDTGIKLLKKTEEVKEEKITTKPIENLANEIRICLKKNNNFNKILEIPQKERFNFIKGLLLKKYPNERIIKCRETIKRYVKEKMLNTFIKNWE
ncbi:MAG: hypothetical protein IPH62_11055 [Ignavibacteriae bacterium]|nr:hypothetical protein [Ignavibacteriota bacterium]